MVRGNISCDLVSKVKVKWCIFLEDNFENLYPPTKGYLRETCKSQNINPVY